MSGAIHSRALLCACGVVALLAAACQPKTAAQSPGSAGAKPSSSAEPAATDEGDSELKQDAMQAMAKLAGNWALLGISNDAREAPSAWHRHAGSNTCMPKGSQSWKLADQRQYAANDESVSLSNESLGIHVTLYTYPARGALDAEFESVMSDMSRTCTEGPMMTTKTGGAHVGGCVQRLPSGLLLLEQAVLFERGKWLHKARITFAAEATHAAYTPAMSVVSSAFGPCPTGAGTAAPPDPRSGA